MKASSFIQTNLKFEALGLLLESDSKYLVAIFLWLFLQARGKDMTPLDPLPGPMQYKLYPTALLWTQLEGNR